MASEINIRTIYTDKFISNLVKKAKAEVSELLTSVLDGKFLMQGAHKSMKVNVVKWQPKIEIPVKFDEENNIDTPVKSVREVRKSPVPPEPVDPQKKHLSPSASKSLREARPTAASHQFQDEQQELNELGIYNDLNSSVQDLDHSHLMDMQKPAVRAAFIDSRASNNMEYVSDRAAFIE